MTMTAAPRIENLTPEASQLIFAALEPMVEEHGPESPVGELRSALIARAPLTPTQENVLASVTLHACSTASGEDLRALEDACADLGLATRQRRVEPAPAAPSRPAQRFTETRGGYRRDIGDVTIDARIAQRFNAYAAAAHPMEIGGLLRVEPTDDGQLHITDLKVFPQRVSGAHFELDGESIARFNMELVREGRREEVPLWRGLVHSHPGFGSQMSGPDVDNLRRLCGNSWAVSAIVATAGRDTRPRENDWTVNYAQNAPLRTLIETLPVRGRDGSVGGLDLLSDDELDAIEAEVRDLCVLPVRPGLLRDLRNPQPTREPDPWGRPGWSGVGLTAPRWPEAAPRWPEAAPDQRFYFDRRPVIIGAKLWEAMLDLRPNWQTADFFEQLLDGSHLDSPQQVGALVTLAAEAALQSGLNGHLHGLVKHMPFSVGGRASITALTPDHIDAFLHEGARHVRETSSSEELTLFGRLCTGEPPTGELAGFVRRVAENWPAASALSLPAWMFDDEPAAAEPATTSSGSATPGPVPAESAAAPEAVPNPDYLDQPGLALTRGERHTALLVLLDVNRKPPANSAYIREQVGDSLRDAEVMRWHTSAGLVRLLWAAREQSDDARELLSGLRKRLRVRDVQTPGADSPTLTRPDFFSPTEAELVMDMLARVHDIGWIDQPVRNSALTTMLELVCDLPLQREQLQTVMYALTSSDVPMKRGFTKDARALAQRITDSFGIEPGNRPPAQASYWYGPSRPRTASRLSDAECESILALLAQAGIDEQTNPNTRALLGYVRSRSLVASDMQPLIMLLMKARAHFVSDREANADELARVTELVNALNRRQ